MADEIKEYLDYEGLEEYHKKSSELFQDLTIQEVEEAFNELDESDPSYSAFYDVISKAKEATQNAEAKTADAVTATTKANEATSKADTATERANKAAEKLETVNDMTTGINLIRGSKDFRIGTNDYVVPGVTNAVYKTDGFNNRGSFTFEKDSEGFTIASRSNSGSSSNIDVMLCSPIVERNADVVTISVEFMVDDVSAFDGRNIGGVWEFDNTNFNGATNVDYFNPSFLNDGTLKSGKWYTIVETINLGSGIKSYSVVLRLQRNGSIHFRKLMVQEGRINNPIWSESPFDQLTSDQGGTGWEHGLNSGINLIPGTSDEWSEWLAPTEYNGSNKGVGVTIRFKIPGEKNINDVFTRLIEIEFENVTATAGQSFGLLVQGQIDTAWPGYYSPVHGIVNLTEPPENGIQRFASQYAPTFGATYLNGEDFTLTFRCDYWASGKFRYRCLKIERGYVEIPQWSPAPEDIAKINDITTGINLLRGTRSFTIGTKPFITKNGITNANYRTDGFGDTPTNFSNGRFSIINKENEFGIFQYNGSGNPSGSHTLLWSNIIDDKIISNGDVFTVSYEFRIIDATNLNYTGTGVQFAYKHADDTDAGSTASYFQTLSTLGLNANNIKVGKWYKCSFQHTVDNVFTDGDWYSVRCRSNSTGAIIQWRKLKLERGAITNPEWSASPFDTDYIQESGINLLRGTRDFKVGSDRIYSSNTGYVTDGFNTIAPFTRSIDDEGFTVISYKRSGLTENNVININASSVKCKAGDTFTLSCEFMSSNLAGIDGGHFISPIASSASDPATLEGYGIDSSSVKAKNGEWTKIVIPIRVTASNAAYLTVRLRMGRNGDLNFRKVCLYKGEVANPVWSPSPFDAVESNDMFDLVSVGTRIMPGADLNDITDYGNYFINSIADAGEIANTPGNIGMAIKVFNLIGTPAQLAISTGCKMYLRRKSASGWMTWVEFNTTNVSPTS